MAEQSMAEQAMAEQAAAASVDTVESSPPTCGICFEPMRHARFLACLHAFCERCLDDLEMRTGHDGTLKCPVCRETTPLPESGASALPRDCTVECAAQQPLQCHTCAAEDGKKKPLANCAACDLAFCAQHAAQHCLDTGHDVEPISQTSASSQSTSGPRLCDHHGLPAKYFCKQCDVTVCSDCAALGEHRHHGPIIPVQEAVEELRERVRRKLDLLKTSRLPEVEKALSAVEGASTEVALRAESVRNRIRSAKRLYDTIELAVQEKLAEVDEVERYRLERLKKQREELERHNENVRKVIELGRQVAEADEETDVSELSLEYERRAEELERAEVDEEPVEHARLDFEPLSEEALLAKVTELVRAFLPGQASERYSSVDGPGERTCFEGSSVNFIVVARNQNGRRLAMGGDIVGCRASPGEKGDIDVRVLDCDNGTYRVTCMPRYQGKYILEVSVNGAKLSRPLIVVCQPEPMTFDPAECQRDIKISGDRRTLTHTGRDGVYSSALSARGMETGRYVWKVRLTKSQNTAVFIGVAEKPGMSKMGDNYTLAYAWSGSDGLKHVKGAKTAGTSPWREDDELQLQLDCTTRTLSIANIRSSETDRIGDLPASPLFAYFSTSNNGDSLTLVE